MILAHGWPGLVIEMLGAIGPLTDPAAHGGSAEDAFDLVLPPIPGYGFSGQPKEVAWDPGRIAQAWAELIHRLGYTRYVAQVRHRFLRGWLRRVGCSRSCVSACRYCLTSGSTARLVEPEVRPT
jgi:hypothetical protein